MTQNNKPLRYAICAGSFDPPTFGHINMIERGLKIFDKIVVAVVKNESKKATFTAEERIDMLQNILRNSPDVEFDSFAGLLVEYAKSKKIYTLLRGIRTVVDYEYELQMSLANRILEPKIETIFVMTEGRFSHISSSIIKEIIRLGGSCKGMIHPYVEKRLKGKLKNEAKGKS